MPLTSQDRQLYEPDKLPPLPRVECRRSIDFGVLFDKLPDVISWNTSILSGEGAVDLVRNRSQHLGIFNQTAVENSGGVMMLTA